MNNAISQLTAKIYSTLGRTSALAMSRRLLSNLGDNSALNVSCSVGTEIHGESCYASDIDWFNGVIIFAISIILTNASAIRPMHFNPGSLRIDFARCIKNTSNLCGYHWC